MSIERRVAINGTYLNPQPQFDGGLTWALQDIHSADSGRAEDGTMIFTVVGKKRKLNFKFAPMSASQANAILALTTPNTFTVSYYDPQENVRKTGTFYKGDRTAEWYSFANEKGEVKSLTFNVIEV